MKTFRTETSLYITHVPIITDRKTKKCKVRVQVSNAHVPNAAVFNTPLSVKVASGYEPRTRIDINKWFDKLTPNF